MCYTAEHTLMSDDFTSLGSCDLDPKLQALYTVAKRPIRAFHVSLVLLLYISTQK